MPSVPLALACSSCCCLTCMHGGSHGGVCVVTYLAQAQRLLLGGNRAEEAEGEEGQDSEASHRLGIRWKEVNGVNVRSVEGAWG